MENGMKKVLISLVVISSLFIGGCQSFQKERDLEMYIIGAGLSYAVGKQLCRTSDNHKEKCGVGAAAAFVLWY